VAGGRGLNGRRAVLTGAGGLLALAMLSPYLVMLITALKPEAELRITPPRLFPVRWQPGNFLEVLGDPAFQGWLVSSLVVAGASTLIVLLAATPASYYVARHRFPGRTAFLFVVLVTQMFSPTALVVGLYREFFELGLVNTYASLILTNAAFNLAFAIWILRAFFASIPREIEEAAAVDGCGRVRTLVQVVLPLALPGLVTAVVFAFIAAWNEYIVALTLMSDPAGKPLPVGITSYVTAYVQHWNQLFAAAVIAIVPVVVLFALIERHLVGGLTAGSVK
jgi:multiple sugar transport system permease protein